MASDCCFKGFEWDGTPTGKEEKLGKNDAYTVGSNNDVAVMVVADLFGWTFTNIRLLCDHYAKEANATVYLPDFFDGQVVPAEILKKPPTEWESSGFDAPAWRKANAKEVRWPEIISCVKTLKEKYKRIAIVGYCYGGWVCFKLGDESLNGLVDCVSAAHPTWVTTEEIDAVGVPVQLIAPEHDPVFTEDMKEYFFKTLSKKAVAFDYQFFPGVVHAFATRGDTNNENEMRAMVRAKNAQVAWMNEWLHGQ